MLHVKINIPTRIPIFTCDMNIEKYNHELEANGDNEKSQPMIL